MRSIFTLSAVISAILIILILPGESHAYIDPGSGLILLQVIIATVIGGFFTFKRFWINILRKLHIISAKEEEKKDEDN
jgi:hypothetical protein